MKPKTVWLAAVSGPAVNDVATRLSSIPSQFLAPHLDLVALAGDVLPGTPLQCLEWAQVPRVRTGAAIALWLLASEELVSPLTPSLAQIAPARIVDALAMRLAPTSDPLVWITDARRREEAARTALLWGGYLPAGEDIRTALSLWKALDSSNRNWALERAAEQERHRAEVQQRLVAAAAKESAARYTRE